MAPNGTATFRTSTYISTCVGAGTGVGKGRGATGAAGTSSRAYAGKELAPHCRGMCHAPRYAARPGS